MQAGSTSGAKLFPLPHDRDMQDTDYASLPCILQMQQRIYVSVSVCVPGVFAQTEQTQRGKFGQRLRDAPREIISE